MYKKSQLSIFIIIFVIIIVVSVFLIFTSGDSVDIDEFGSSSFQNVDGMITSCLDETVLDGVEFVLVQGGYYTTPNKFLTHYYLSIPIYLEGENENIPTIEFMEKQLSMYIDDNFMDCFDSFLGFNEIGYEIEIGNVSSNVSILYSRIKTDINFPVIIDGGEDKQFYNNFKSVVDFEFGKKYDVVIGFIDEQKKDMEYIPLSYLTNLADKNNFTYEYLPQDDGGVVYSFIFGDVNDKFFVYSFGVKYDWEDLGKE